MDVPTRKRHGKAFISPERQKLTAAESTQGNTKPTPLAGAAQCRSIGRSGLDTCEGYLQRTGKRLLQLPSDYAPLPVTSPKSSGYLHGTPGQPCKGSRGTWLRSRSHPERHFCKPCKPFEHWRILLATRSAIEITTRRIVHGPTQTDSRPWLSLTSLMMQTQWPRK